eukprot:CAMPEP_0117825550 /NCGR_PEP_ID=MMETSP0949-20121206/5548_1 /TAXON_ID=44440 /ORGANISM="Chattonella subsalsa, Strain CCMP2191" /LENGTH=110 /DNA_ID=CAMNT_0005665553 /DNA_START=207 /DNA_END=539 /DNA_ORIENTATION=-
MSAFPWRYTAEVFGLFGVMLDSRNFLWLPPKTFNRRLRGQSSPWGFGLLRPLRSCIGAGVVEVGPQVGFVHGLAPDHRLSPFLPFAFRIGGVLDLVGGGRPRSRATRPPT